MAAGVTDRLFDVSDLVALLEAEEKAGKERGKPVAWRLLSKTLKIVGMVASIGLFCTEMYLIEHWRLSRPYKPDPALGWIVRLPWCLGAYGSAKESQFLDTAFEAGLWSILMIFASAIIDYYKFGVWPLKTPPK